jgi:hypothetical protein
LISDAQVQAELASQIASGAVPPNAFDAEGNTNTLYFVYLPKGVSVTLGSGSPPATSCVDFCAYHSTFVSGGHDVLYAVMPDMSAGSGCDQNCLSSLSPLARTTVVASHEMAEAMTDAEIGLVPGISVDDAGTLQLRPAAWYDGNANDILDGIGGEVGDICEHFPPESIVDGTGASWTVQMLWSNVSEECVVSHLSNGGFENGLTAWTTSGSVTTSALGHPGSSVMLGNPRTATGDSTVSQSFDLPDPSIGGGTITLSFAYTGQCTAGSGGWFSASVLDVSTGATIPLLPQTCVPAGGWTQTSPLDVTSIHGDTITLTFANHDPASASSRTTTWVDNVKVSIMPPSPSNPIVNASFEDDTNGWTAIGDASWTGVSVGDPVYTGRFSGVTGDPWFVGDSSLAQTFTAQPGSSTIQFFSYVACSDTVATDWATATLLDNTTGVTTTLLPKTCSNTATWNRIAGTVVPGHSYTISLTSHDDGVGSTIMAYWDDVSVQ